MTHQVIEIEEEMLSLKCLLFCPICETVTNHVLLKSHEGYVCACGDCVEIEIKEIEDEKGE